MMPTSGHDSTVSIGISKHGRPTHKNEGKELRCLMCVGEGWMDRCGRTIKDRGWRMSSREWEEWEEGHDALREQFEGRESAFLSKWSRTLSLSKHKGEPW